MIEQVLRRFILIIHFDVAGQKIREGFQLFDLNETMIFSLSKY